MKWLVAIVVLAVVATIGAASQACAQQTTPVAEPFEDADAAYRHGDYATALALLRPLAEQGLAKAQYDLGAMYHHGWGVWRDYSEALKWYRQAADQGDVVAQNNVGQMYLSGRGVRQDYAEALKWYRQAADQGFVMAQDALGVMYAEGRGVPQDYVLAHMWFNLAASQGKFKDAVEQRDKIATKMTRELIAEAQKLAREWKPKSER
jgi:uncharacterized protein